MTEKYIWIVVIINGIKNGCWYIELYTEKDINKEGYGTIRNYKMKISAIDGYGHGWFVVIKIS